MPGVFISYRREDSSAYAGRLYDRLANHFGKDNVFMDVDSIELGLDFIEVLDRTISVCDAVVVVIGKQWLTVADSDGRRRLDDPEDLVRVEVAAALDRKVRVVPALVAGARMPRSHELPQPIALLSRRNALEISDTSFHQSVTRLIEALDKAIAKPQPPPAPEPVPPTPLPAPPVIELRGRDNQPVQVVPQPAPVAESLNPGVSLWRRSFLLYQPHGNETWVSLAWGGRVIFSLSVALALMSPVFVYLGLDPPSLRLMFYWLGGIGLLSRLAADGCERLAAKKGRAAITEPSDRLACADRLLKLPRWRRAFLLYLPYGRPGWVYMSWLFRVGTVFSTGILCILIVIGFTDHYARSEASYWEVFAGFLAGTVLLRFVTSWFDRRAAQERAVAQSALQTGQAS